MQITLKHNETEIEVTFSTAIAKDKVDVMKIISHVVSEFQSIQNNTKDLTIKQHKEQNNDKGLQ
jgi:hypothetical protein